jgi:hypothetical protein
MDSAYSKQVEKINVSVHSSWWESFTGNYLCEICIEHTATESEGTERKMTQPSF